LYVIVVVAVAIARLMELSNKVSIEHTAGRLSHDALDNAVRSMILMVSPMAPNAGV
jgi:hypothetical protein